MTKNFRRWPVNSKVSRSFIRSFVTPAIWLTAVLAPCADDKSDAAASIAVEAFLSNLRFSLSRRIRNLSTIGLALALASTGPANVVKAQAPAVDKTTQAVDTAVQVFADVGNMAGLPIDQSEVPIIQGIVNCAVSSTTLSGGDCAKNIVVSLALNQIGASDIGATDKALADAVGTAAGCLVNGGSAASCVGAGLVKQLPADAQALANCVIGGGNVGDCTEKAALAQILPQVQGAVNGGLPADVADTVNCVINGKSLATCAQKLVASQVDQALAAAKVPDNVKTTVDMMVSCVANGGNAGSCAQQAATQNLPTDVQGLASCLSAPNAAAQTCVANFAASKMPPGPTQNMVGCMGQPGDQAQKCLAGVATQVGVSAAQQAQQAAVQAALATIQKLNVTAGIADTSQFPQTPAVLQNLVAVANGIKDGNWGEVTLGAGPEILEIAGKIILSVFLTPALADVLAPVVDAMIQNDVNSLKDGFTALSKGDAVGAAEVIFKWYETTFIQAPCALMPPGSFSNAACGDAAKAINWVANEGGDVAKGILGAGKDILKWLGLWNLADNVASTAWNDVTSVIGDIGHFLGLDGAPTTTVITVCTTTPAQFFANNVMNSSCLASSTSGADASGQADVSQVVAACVSYYGQCSSDKTTVQNNCQKMGDALSAAGVAASKTVDAAASDFTNAGAATFAAKILAENIQDGEPDERDLCSSTFWTTMQQSYADYCAAAIGKFFPASFGQSNPNSCPIPTSTSAERQACLHAITSNTSKSLWAGAADSAYCAKEKQTMAIEAELDPCKVVKTTQVGWGQVFNLPTPECTPLFRPVPGPWNRGPPLPAFPNFLPGARNDPVTIPYLKLPPTIIVKFPANEPRNTFPLLPRPTSLPLGLRLPPRISLPKGTPANNGGSGGAYFVNGNSGNAPIKGGSSGGGSGNSAMDKLGDLNTGGGINGVAGNSGGLGPARPGIIPRGGPLGGGLPPPKQPTTASGGKGGISTVNGNSGNAPIKPATNTPAANTAIDYGGCGGCGKPTDDLHVR